MKKLSDNKTLIAIWIISIAVIIVSLVALSSKDSVIYSMSLLLTNIIQSIAVVTLVLITLFYAKQTQDLVDQEKIRLEEDRKKSNVDFREKSLQEFGMPMLFRIKKFNGALKDSSNLEQFNKQKNGIIADWKKIIEVNKRFAYLSPKNYELEMVELTKSFQALYDLTVGEETEYAVLKKNAMLTLNSVLKVIQEQNKKYFEIINKYYEII